MSESQTIVLERWSKDPEFRNWPRTDPAAAVASLGVSVSDRDQEALDAVDWTLEDDELERQFLKATASVAESAGVKGDIQG